MRQSLLWTRNHAHYRIHVVLPVELVTLFSATPHASMYERIRRTSSFERDGFHQGAAIRGAIPWIYIHMFAPQAFRTMVCVTVPLYKVPAMLTLEIFDRSFKTHTSLADLLRWKHGVLSNGVKSSMRR